MEERDLFSMPLSEARLIAHDPSSHVPTKTNFVRMVLASHAICDSPEATLDDLLACASCPFGSANWRPTHLLHERMGVPKRFDDHGFIIRDVGFWRDYVSRLSHQSPDGNTGKA